MFDLRGKELKYAKHLPLKKIRAKFYELQGHMDRVKTAVKNHFRKMFRSRIHKSAERDTAA